MCLKDICIGIRRIALTKKVGMTIWLTYWLTFGSNKFYPSQFVELVAFLSTSSTSNVSWIFDLYLSLYSVFIFGHRVVLELNMTFYLERKWSFYFSITCFSFVVYNNEFIGNGTERTAYPFPMYRYFTCEFLPKVRYYTFWILSTFCLDNINRKDKKIFKNKNSNIVMLLDLYM